MTVVIFQVTYLLQGGIVGSHEALRLSLHSAKEGWNSSPASGGTQPICSSDTDMNICKKMLHFMSGGSHSHHMLRNSIHSPF